MNDPLLRLDTVGRKLASHLGVSQTTLRSHLAIWRTQIVSLRARANWQEAWRAARPILVFAAAYIASWSYLVGAASGLRVFVVVDGGEVAVAEGGIGEWLACRRWRTEAFVHVCACFTRAQ